MIPTTVHDTGYRSKKAAHPDLRELDKRPLKRLNRLIIQYPQVSHEQLMDMFREYRRTGNTAIFNEIIATNLRLAAWFIGPWLKYRVSNVDLVQEALIGMVDAAKRFDPDYGVRFSTYATPWMRARVNRFIVYQSAPVHYPSRAKVTDLPKRISLDTPRTDDEWSEESTLYSDERVNPPVPSPEDDLLETDIGQLRHNALIDALDVLNERELDIIKHRYLLDDKQTLANIAERYGVTRQAIMLTERKALNKLGKRVRNIVNEALWLPDAA